MIYSWTWANIEPGRFYRHSYKPLLLRKKDPNEKISIKTDEMVIVILVLLAWFAIICLFIKKWGKIRAIEPCQSYFSPEIYDIPLKKSMLRAAGSLDLSPGTIGPTGTIGSTTGQIMVSTESRKSLAGITNQLRRDSLYYLQPSPSYMNIQRPRINSVFVTPPTRPPTPLPPDPTPRRYKSAEDLRSIVNELTRRKSTLLMSPTHFMKQQSRDSSSSAHSNHSSAHGQYLSHQQQLQSQHHHHPHYYNHWEWSLLSFL